MPCIVTCATTNHCTASDLTANFVPCRDITEATTSSLCHIDGVLGQVTNHSTKNVGEVHVVEAIPSFHTCALAVLERATKFGCDD